MEKGSRVIDKAAVEDPRDERVALPPGLGAASSSARGQRQAPVRAARAPLTNRRNQVLVEQCQQRPRPNVGVHLRRDRQGAPKEERLTLLRHPQGDEPGRPDRARVYMIFSIP